MLYFQWFFSEVANERKGKEVLVSTQVYWALNSILSHIDCGIVESNKACSCGGPLISFFLDTTCIWWKFLLDTFRFGHVSKSRHMSVIEHVQ